MLSRAVASARAIAVVLAVNGFSLACNRNPQPGEAGPPQMPPTPVALQAAVLSPVDDTTEYVATLKSLRSTTVQPQIDGQVTQIFVKSGDRVAQGASLIQIDPRRQQAAVSSLSLIHISEP